MNEFRQQFLKEKTERSQTQLKDNIVDRLPAPLPSDTEEARDRKQKKREQLRKMIDSWEGNDELAGVERFYENVFKDFASEPTNREQRIGAFKMKLRVQLESEFDEKEILVIATTAVSERERYAQYLVLRKLEALARHKGRNGVNDAMRILADPSLTDAEKSERLDGLYHSAAREGNAELAGLITREDVVSKQIQAIDLREQDKQKQTALQEKMGNQSYMTRVGFSLEKIDLPGLQALQALNERGGADITQAIVAGGAVKNTPSGVIGKIEGEQLSVSLRNGEMECAMIHEGQRIPLTGNLGTQAFNDARLTGIAGTIHSEFLEEPSPAREKIWESLFKRHEGRHFMTTGEAGLTEAVCKTLLKGCSSKQEETAVLKKLHFLTADEKPNEKFLTWWTMELHFLTQNVTAEQLPDLLRPDLLYPLAEKWTQENKLTLRTFDQL